MGVDGILMELGLYLYASAGSEDVARYVAKTLFELVKMLPKEGERCLTH